ncbi:NUDIX domain-containing protein [Streptomyces sp. SID4919]|uniref:NUDIX hydrolase n=1 Tax=unclassified Streptomyces TaxID=2593676 RepID=UPI000823BD01|nr:MULTISPECIES: NUDIX hydrolase [unclassified Streptomyces]MYY12928.1 NUDIX domain-containing protein [Streptomyces sp. SID4919]SCK22305.1 ADP-ribose pyrophosphatase YjhB, NUDIX family [Streptomyces sp. AmelKG-E11A]
MRNVLRVAAYAVCVDDGRILLARWVARDGARRWTLPGGGMDHGEDPYDTCVREVAEETGYRVEPHTLLGADTLMRPREPGPLRRSAEVHALRLVYEARVTGGSLRDEKDGSTDRAAWHPLAEVPGLVRVDLVDHGLRLWRERPPAGRFGVPPRPQDEQTANRYDGSPDRG